MSLPIPPPSRPASGRSAERGWATRGRSKLMVLSLGTVLLLYLTYRLITPIFPALVWAGTLAVVTHPLLVRLRRHVHRPAWRAALLTGGVAIAVLLPLSALGIFAAMEIGQTIGGWESPDNLTRLQQQFTQSRWLGGAWRWVSENLMVGGEARAFAGRIRETAVAIVSGSMYIAFQTVLTLFILFYLYRDQDEAIDSVRRLSPLHGEETDELLRRLADTVYATVLGIVVVAMVQGALGGLMFWILGLSAAIFWGIVMGLLAIIPYLGAFIIWVPAAIILAVQGSWGKALILTVWGSLVVGLIDNLLYPILVGERLRQHTLVAFVAIVGGVTTFGATGVVLGPLIVSATLFLLEVWRRRTAHGLAAEQS